MAALVDYNDIDFNLEVTQNRDPKITEIKMKLENEKKEESNLESKKPKNFLIIDGLVCRKQTEDLNLLYVPAEMEEYVCNSTCL